MSKGKTEQITLPIEEVAVQERQVTIRVLTVGTRQITQTLYKQLPEEQVIDLETGVLKGNVWGWVNLHEAECDKNGNTPRNHLHAIWEDNRQLKRAYVSESSNYKGWREYFASQLSDLAAIYALYVAIDGKGFTNWKKEQSHLVLTVKGVHVRAKILKAASTIWEAPEKIKDYQQRIENDPDCPSWYKDNLDRVIKEVKSLREDGVRKCIDEYWYQYEDLDPEQYHNHEEVYREMEKRALAIQTREHNWEESYKTIKQAGQLFVAVSGVWK